LIVEGIQAFIRTIFFGARRYYLKVDLFVSALSFLASTAFCLNLKFPNYFSNAILTLPIVQLFFYFAIKIFFYHH
jgi:hypothetical protein